MFASRPETNPAAKNQNGDNGNGIVSRPVFFARVGRRLRPSIGPVLSLLFVQRATGAAVRCVGHHRLADGDFEVLAHEKDALGCCEAFGADPGQARFVERGT